MKRSAHWVMIPPLRSIEESLKELHWAKDHGAVGVFFRGIEGNYTLDNPYFFPVYQAAMDVDLPICIHTGSGTPSVTAMFDLERNRQWSHSGFPPLHAFRDLVLNQIPEMFPRLRFGFIEASASWALTPSAAASALVPGRWVMPRITESLPER